MVQRPRQYVYHSHPNVQAYTVAQAKDSRVSFYSGHGTEVIVTLPFKPDVKA